MIPRYTREKIKAVWEPENRFQKWLDVELAACYAHMKEGTIPEKDYQIIEEKAGFDVKRIDEIEAEVHHDVIAFLTSVAEHIGESSRYVHLGLTSSDVVDTAFSMLIQDAGQILKEGLDKLMSAMEKRAKEHQLTPMMGRTHGVHAEPLTFGLKMTVWYEEMKRNKARLDEALEQTRVGKLSGAVGNYAHMPPKIEQVVCERVGLVPSKASTQTLQRDRHAHFMTTLAIIAGTLEKIATEIRALQKTEMNEVIEPFAKGQKGSSAMPHKRNPIVCERVTGLARVIRGYAVTAMENQALWHERDISHSSTERVIFPDATIALDYMLDKMTTVIAGMQVNEAQMKENLGKSYDVYYSQQLLLQLVNKGLLREKAYRVVQRNAHAAFDERISFEEKIREDKEITDILNQDELSQIFNFEKYTNHIPDIYETVYNR